MKMKRFGFCGIASFVVSMLIPFAVLTGCGSKPAEKVVAEQKTEQQIEAEIKSRVEALAAEYNKEEYVDLYGLYMSSELRELMNKGWEKDEMYLEADAFLNVQDYETITAEIEAVNVKSETEASVSMCFVDSYSGKLEPTTLEFIYENGEWRVDDIITDGWSLKTATAEFLNSPGGWY